MYVYVYMHVWIVRGYNPGRMGVNKADVCVCVCVYVCVCIVCRCVCGNENQRGGWTGRGLGVWGLGGLAGSSCRWQPINTFLTSHPAKHNFPMHTPMHTPLHPKPPQEPCGLPLHQSTKSTRALLRFDGRFDGRFDEIGILRNY